MPVRTSLLRLAVGIALSDPHRERPRRLVALVGTAGKTKQQMKAEARRALCEWLNGREQQR
ncbi:hypothetical protein [Caballeronia mineralivorans]|uniref:hypothetical protein n=1 Tax=Caballeronia mineralivorans TaxID=2010198 RepID=UPI002AFE72EF|nr:hypothetical protein [Caballeronia mineralivorans]